MDHWPSWLATLKNRMFWTAAGYLAVCLKSSPVKASHGSTNGDGSKSMIATVQGTNIHEQPTISGYQAFPGFSELFRAFFHPEEASKCTAQPKDVGDLDTGGQCRWTNCHPSRGLTRCVSYKCLCLAGYRAAEGKCVPKEGMRYLAFFSGEVGNMGIFQTSRASTS